jgi:retron-type reverse transcriptase
MATTEPNTLRPATRDELYERIRKGGKDSFILEDMRRLGFWPSESGQPSLPTTLAQREAELMRELSALNTERTRLEDRQALLKQLRKQRMAESMQKRQETKERNKQKRIQKAAEWAQRKQQDILYLGDGVSGGLQNQEAAKSTLASSFSMPLFATAKQLAEAMGISVSELRFLTFHRPVSRIHHYQRFQIPKKTGGVRVISAPMPRLKKAQRWVLDNILVHPWIHEDAHGFVMNRSIVSNAKAHVQRDLVLNLDLKDFFPSVGYPRVKGVFKGLGHSEVVATILALLCTEAEVESVLLDGQQWYLHVGGRHLPQGAPTSPAITNLICMRLDRRLANLAKKHGFTYTRYADDLTFSAIDGHKKSLNKLRHLVKVIIADEGFVVHPNKEQVMRKGARKEVTGLVVNDRVSVDRSTLRRFRALLHQVKRDGSLDGKSWGSGTDLSACMMGFASFVYMVDPVKGGALIQEVKELVKKVDPGYSTRYRKPKPPVAKTTEPTDIPIEEGKFTLPSSPTEYPPKDKGKEEKPWWKFWG